jgi:hypothetical protein
MILQALGGLVAIVAILSVFTLIGWVYDFFVPAITSYGSWITQYLYTAWRGFTVCFVIAVLTLIILAVVYALSNLFQYIIMTFI